MFSRLATLAKPAAKSASAPGRSLLQVRYLTEQATATGSKGRKMPFNAPRATTPVDSLPATLTIRVRTCPTPSPVTHVPRLT